MKINLQIARGLAALAVFLFHTRGLLHESLPALERLVQFGDLGVPLFFVISGYVITASANATVASGGSAPEFLKRRFLRIFPPFWFSIAVIVALPYVLEAISMLKTGTYGWPSPRFLALSLAEWVQVLSLTKIFAHGGTGLYAEFELINIVYWTLAIEFQFYLVVFFALLFRRRFTAILLLTTLASIITIATPGVVNGGVFLHFWPMFALGIVLWYLIRKRLVIERTCGHPVAVSLTIVLPTSAAVLWLAYSGQLRSVLEAFAYAEDFGFALICFGLLWASTPLEPHLAAFARSDRATLRLPVLAGCLLGEISYSLYLLHTQIVALPSMFARQLFAYGDLPFVLVVILGTLLVCYIFYLYCEKPFASGSLESRAKAKATIQQHA
jgi:peptidoglycan/LPS O-acetylase OafA/YrhL